MFICFMVFSLKMFLFCSSFLWNILYLLTAKITPEVNKLALHQNERFCDNERFIVNILRFTALKEYKVRYSDRSSEYITKDSFLMPRSFICN